jgi:hypothetical protein
MERSSNRDWTESCADRVVDGLTCDGFTPMNSYQRGSVGQRGLPGRIDILIRASGITVHTGFPQVIPGPR